MAASFLLAGCTSQVGSSGNSAQSQPAMNIELPNQEAVKIPFTVSGWAVDLSSIASAGIEAVQVLDGGCEGIVIGIAEYGLERPDIESSYGVQFRYSGWQFEVTRLRPGDHSLAVRTKSSGLDDYNQCQVIPLKVD